MAVIFNIVMALEWDKYNKEDSHFNRALVVLHF